MRRTTYSSIRVLAMLLMVMSLIGTVAFSAAAAPGSSGGPQPSRAQSVEASVCATVDISPADGVVTEVEVAAALSAGTIDA